MGVLIAGSNDALGNCFRNYKEVFMAAALNPQQCIIQEHLQLQPYDIT